MKIAIGHEMYDTETMPVLIYFTAQERLDVIGMAPNKNVLVLAPNSMPSSSIEKWGTRHDD